MAEAMAPENSAKFFPVAWAALLIKSKSLPTLIPTEAKRFIPLIGRPQKRKFVL